MSALSLSRIRRGLESPTLFLREINRLYYRTSQMISNTTPHLDLLAEDWDNLLILDACRYDIFSKYHTLPGTLEARISPASSTIEFLEKVFDGKELLDTVYVTANPQLYRHQDDLDVQFYKDINVWKKEGWDTEQKTVQPDTVTEYACRAADTYPNKRILVHYIQPHYPFIGPTGQEAFSGDQLNFWQNLMIGDEEYDSDTLWEAYIENLEVAMPAVRKAMETLGGKTVVTADHGQMIGERSWPVPIQEYGHPRGVYTDELVKIPWLINQKGERRKIQEDSPEDNRSDVQSDIVHDRLKSLGYK